jgi:tetratricopeptide (TPR) repeat protein
MLAVHKHSFGHFQAVAEIYQAMLVKIPGYAEGHNNRGTALQNLEHHKEALACYDRAIALKPDYANAHFNRGSLLKKMGRLEEALAAYDRSITLNPLHAEALNNRSALLQILHRHNEALKGYDQVLAIRPDHAEALNNRGTVLASLGRMAEAEQMFRRAGEVRPQFIDAWYNLTESRRYTDPEDADARQIRTLLQQDSLTASEREQLLFALGKILDDCDLADEAFDCFRQANELRGRQVTYDSERVTRLTDAIIEVFSAEFLALPSSAASSNSMPLFIVGMPRSGTTLLANILSNHAGIAQAGELPVITGFANDLRRIAGTRMAYPHGIKHLPAEAARALVRNHEQQLRHHLRPGARYVIDKNPLNFRHLGLIARLFPKSRIIHCTRSAKSAALSNYFQRFPLTLDYSFDLRHIAHFQGEYLRLMNHWRILDGLKLIEVSYEDMVTQTETVARSLLEFLGLDWDERCLSPHTNPAPVETASKWQVRQPIYTRSVERWRRYEKHLAPWEEAFAAAGRVLAVK